MISRSTCPLPNTLPRTARNQKPHHVPVECWVCGQWCFCAEEWHGARVSSELSFIMDYTRFSPMAKTVCATWQNSSLEFKDTFPVKAKVGLPHRWWNVVWHIATLILVFMMRLSCVEQMERAEHFLRLQVFLGSSMIPEPGLSLRVVLFGAQCDKPRVSTSTSEQCLFQSQMDNTVKSNTQELARLFRYLGYHKYSACGTRQPEDFSPTFTVVNSFMLWMSKRPIGSLLSLGYPGWQSSMVVSHCWEAAGMCLWSGNVPCWMLDELIRELVMSGAIVVWMMHCLSTASDFGVESHHWLHSDKTVAALLRHLCVKWTCSSTGIVHPLEQHRESNENFACEILQLFVLALITLNPDSSPLLRRTSRPFLSVFWCKGQPSPWNRGKKNQEKDQSDGHLPT